ncbi:hypothetical protein D3C80_2105230 [compost metagenome]
MTQAGHVQQILDITVQAFGFVTRALKQLLAILHGDRLAKGQKAVDAAAHGSQGRAQVMRH